MTTTTRRTDTGVPPRLFAANHGQLGLTCPGWSVAAAAVTGSSHVRGGLPCQDAFHVRETADGFVAVLCDGAGSAPRADIGAAVVSAAVCEHLAVDELTDLDKATVLRVANEAIARRAAMDGCEPPDYACTLLAVKVQGDMAATYHLGDGVIIAGRCGRPELLSGPDRGEYANTTVFVNSANALQSLRVLTHRLDRETRSILLTTDGMQATLLDGRTAAVSQVAEQMASWLEQGTPAEAAGGLHGALGRHFSTRTHDDCSVVVARRLVKTNEHFPPTCPACARWLVAGVKGKRGSVRLTCGNCSAQYDYSAAQGRKPRLEPLPAGPATDFDRRALPALSVLCRTNDDYMTRSLRLTCVALTQRPFDWPSASAGFLKAQMASRLSKWASRRVINPLALILGTVSIPGYFSGMLHDVAVGINQDGRREILGFEPRHPEGGPGAFLARLIARGALDPALVVVAGDDALTSEACGQWPQASCRARTPGLARLIKTTSIRTIEREMELAARAWLAGGAHASEPESNSLIVVALGTLYDLSARWAEGRRYVVLDGHLDAEPCSGNSPRTTRCEPHCLADE